MASNITVTVVYPAKARIISKDVELPAPATVLQAIEASNIVDECPELNFASLNVGVFNQLVELSEAVSQGDRIEIYRPLLADPKDARRKRAEKSA